MPLFSSTKKKSKKEEDEESSDTDSSDDEESSEEEDSDEEEGSSSEEGDDDEDEDEGSSSEEEDADDDDEDSSDDEDSDEDESSDEESVKAETKPTKKAAAAVKPTKKATAAAAAALKPKAGKKGKVSAADLERLAALERKAVAEATATADAAFAPAPTLLNADSPKEVMKQVNGPSLKEFQAKDNVYVGKSVPVPAGSSLVVPIPVAMPGSVVEYSVELKNLDISFGITAERDEGITVVKEPQRTVPSDDPLTGKFLVGTVPCTIQFSFENEYSWFREKVVSYRVTVTPPTKESLVAGRERRAKSCLTLVQKETGTTKNEIKTKKKESVELKAKIGKLQTELKALEKSLEKAQKDETALETRLKLRQEQTKLLQKRLKDPEYEDPDEVAALPVIPKSKAKAKKGKK